MSDPGDFLGEGAELPMGRGVRGMGAWSPLREWSQLPLRASCFRIGAKTDWIRPRLQES